MKRFFNLTLVVIFALLVAIPGEAFAASVSPKKKNQTPAFQSIDALSSEGSTYIYGSVLDPNVNQVLLLLPKQLLFTIRKLGLTKLKTDVVSTLDSTKTYSIPISATNIQTKKVNGKIGKYLIANISNLTTQSGITISPSSLPTGDYRVRIEGGELDLTTNTFNYQTPVLIVGIVKSNSAGFIRVEDLEGNVISEKTVAISPNGSFLTEVRTNKLGSVPKSRIKLKVKKTPKTGNDTDVHESTTTNSEEINEEIGIGLVHAITDKDLLAIVPLNNKVEDNAAKINKPIEISEGTTLTAALGKEYDVIANEAAEDELKKLESSEEEQEESFDEFGCDIYQFADRCTDKDEEILSSIGADFKQFTQNATCTFSEFDFLQSIVSQAPDDLNSAIGRGYCSAVGSEEINDNKPCEEYVQIISSYKNGVITHLPCPPEFCDEFRNIKPPKCVNPIEFCDETNTALQSVDTCRGSRCKTPLCINRPVRDLYCARIGVDVSEVECRNGIDVRGRSTDWTVVTSSEGNQYCIPASITKSGIAEECEVSACHRNCEDNNITNLSSNSAAETFGDIPGQGCEVCDCHFSCDADAGRIIDCGNPKSKYFSNKCCSRGVVGPALFTQVSQTNLSSQQLSPSQNPRGGIISQDIRGCLCQDQNNFSENGFIKLDAQNNCKNKCPSGFEKDSNSDSCLIICSEGLVRDPRGFCKRKCPEGFVQDDFGSCRCPEGQTIGRGGKCEIIEGTCPEYCKSYFGGKEYLAQVNSGFTSPKSGPGFVSPQTGPGFASPQTNTGFIPPECQKCSDGGGPGICSPGQKKDPVTGQCINENRCGVDQYSDANGICRCNYDGSVATSLGPEGCKKQNQCSGATPYSYKGSCVVSCPPPLVPGTIGGNTTPYQPPYSQPSFPSTVPSSVSSTPRTKAVLKASHDLVGTFGNQQYECLCPGQIQPDANGQCGGTGQCGSNMLPNNVPGEAQCICPTGLPYMYYGQCVAQCPSGSPPSPNATINLPPKSPISCGSNTTRTCSPGEVSNSYNSCTCASGAVPKAATPSFADSTGATSGTICQCTNGQTYTVNGCNTSTTHVCAVGETYSSNNPCYCAGSAYLYQNTCTCPSGQTYGVNGCNSSTMKCPSPYITDPAFPQQCTCPTSIPYELGATCVATCPSNLVASTAPGGFGSTRKVCKCPDSTYPNNNGVCGATTTTCAPGQKSTSTSPCTCASGATSFSDTTGGISGTVCTCPSGQTYSVTGCDGSTTTNSVTLNSVSLDGEYVTINGSSSVTSYTTCFDLKTTNNEIINTSNFNCGSFIGYTGPTTSFNSNLKPGALVKLCIQNSQTCSQSVTVTSKPICTPGQVYTTSNPCTCAVGGGAQFKAYYDKVCNCPSGLTYTTTGCSGTPICASGQKSTSASPCTCASGSTSFSDTTGGISGTVCTCPSGQTYSASGCTLGGVPNAPTLTAMLAPSDSLSVQLTWTDNSSNETEFKIYFRPLGTSSWTYGTVVGPNITSYTDWNRSPPGSYEYHVNACNATGCSSDSNIATATTVAPRITLGSASVTGGDTITFSFSKDTSDAFKLYSSGGILLDVPGHAFGGASGASYPLSTLNSNLQSGIQVKICYSSEPTVCSNAVTLSGSFNTHTCAANEAYGSGNICNCANGGTPDLQNKCSCPSGQTYSTGGCQSAPPTISSVQVSSKTSSTATITWTTDIASDSQVEYGISSFYGNSTALDSAPVTSHSVTITGLNPNTIYYYKVRSSVGSSLSTVGGYNFTTNAQETINLQSVLINNNNVVVRHNQNFDACAHMKTQDDTTVFMSTFFFCHSVQNSSSYISLSNFNSPFTSGSQVKLCHPTLSSVCSQTVTAVSVPTCEPGQNVNDTTLVNPSCLCSPGAYVTSGGTCACSNGNTYTVSTTNGCT